LGNPGGDVAQEDVLPGEDGCVQGDGQQDVARRSATTDGSLNGYHPAHSCRAEMAARADGVRNRKDCPIGPAQIADNNKISVPRKNKNNTE